MYSINLSVKSPKLRVLTKSLAKIHDAIKNQGELKTKEKNTRWNSKMHQFWSFLEFHSIFLCFFPVRLDNIIASSMNEKCFKLQMWGFKLRMWGVVFLNERWILWVGCKHNQKSYCVQGLRTWKGLVPSSWGTW